MLSNKKLNPIGTELLIRGIKLDISLVFITQSVLFYHTVLFLSHNLFHKLLE